MSTLGTAARVLGRTARTTRPAHPSRWPAGTLAAAGMIPGPPMNASATLVISAGHHPANYRSAIPARAYESGSGHGHDAAPAGHPHPAPTARPGPGATAPMPAASIIGSRRPASRAPAASPRRALRAPLTRAPDRTTGAATRARAQTAMPENPPPNPALTGETTENQAHDLQTLDGSASYEAARCAFLSGVLPATRSDQLAISR